MSKTIEVLLKEHVKDLGRCGDVVRVTSGYARNYLLPYKLAMPASEDNKRQIARRAARLAAEDAAREAEVTSVVAKLSELVVKTSQKADETGSLYGSVSAAQIAELCTAAGTPLEEKQVRLETPIKSVGEHKVLVHVHGDHEAEVTVKVEASAS